jgi:hypothetical protein
MDAELEKWMDIWEKSQEKNIFPPEPKQDINPQVYQTDYFGNICKGDKDTVVLNDCDAKYWSQVYHLSKRGNDTPDILHEQTSKINGIGTEEPLASAPQGKLREVPSRSDLGVKGAELGNTANPIEHPSRGDDSRTHVTPEWADGKGLRELVYMKHNLYNLEVKINSNPKFGAYGEEAPEIKKIQTQIDELNHNIDELANSLSPTFMSDELS